MADSQEGGTSEKTAVLDNLKKRKFCVVGFEEDGKIEVIPTKWLRSKTEAKWPSFSSSVQIKDCITKCKPAGNDWTTQAIAIYNFSNSFKRASAKATRLLETSAVSSDSPEETIETHRKRKRPERYQSELSSDEELGDENQSQSIISRKQYFIPKLPGCSKKPPPKNVFKSRPMQINKIEASHKDTDSSQSPINSRAVLESTENGNYKHNDVQSALFQRMFKYMESLNSKLNHLNEKIDKLMVKNTIATSENSTLDFLPSNVQLPCNTEEELAEFNNKIKNDRELSAVMVRYLHGAGNGKTACSFVLSLTRKVLAQDLAMKFSRYGRKGKKSFLVYNETMTIILAAAALRFKDLEKDSLSDSFGKALAGAADWNGRKPRSSEKRAENVDCSLTFNSLNNLTK